MKPSDFYTVPLSEQGVRVPLLKPDGSLSGEWIRVIGPDSPAYALARDQVARRSAEVTAIEDPKARDAAAIDALLEFREQLIIEWSFDEPLNSASVRAFMVNAPRIAVQIDQAAGDIGRFFGPASESSTPGPNASDASEAAVTSSSPSDSGQP